MSTSCALCRSGWGSGTEKEPLLEAAWWLTRQRALEEQRDGGRGGAACAGASQLRAQKRDAEARTPGGRLGKERSETGHDGNLDGPVTREDVRDGARNGRNLRRRERL